MARLAQIAEADSDVYGQHEPEARPRCRARILIVDDEAFFGRTLSVLLGGAHDVTVVTRGKQALALLSSDGDFDLVLCDLALPDLPGAELYRQVASNNRDLAGRFVFITGGAYTDATREFLAQHPGAWIEKPFPFAEIERRLEAIGSGEGPASGAQILSPRV